MPPIRTFKSAPINPNSAATTTSDSDQQQAQQNQVVANSDEKQNVPAAVPATLTAAALDSNLGSYPAARPGAPAMPAPTSTASTSTTFTPTKTYAMDGTESPPAPQPVGRPEPPPQSSYFSPSSTPATGSTPTKSVVPPPPKKGEPIQPPSYYAPRLDSPSSGHQPQIPNSTSTPYLSTYQPPTSQPQLQRDPFAHTIGHQQQHSEESGLSKALNNTFGEGTGQDMLNTAKSWMASAGTKLAEAEEEVWRMVNSNSK